MKSINTVIDEVLLIPVYRTNSHVLRLICVNPVKGEGSISPVYVEKENIINLFKSMSRAKRVNNHGELVDKSIILDVQPMQEFLSEHGGDEMEVKGVPTFHDYVPLSAQTLSGKSVEISYRMFFA